VNYEEQKSNSFAATKEMKKENNSNNRVIDIGSKEKKSANFLVLFFHF